MARSQTPPTTPVDKPVCSGMAFHPYRTILPKSYQVPEPNVHTKKQKSSGKYIMLDSACLIFVPGVRLELSEGRPNSEATDRQKVAL